jgi:hypothetical protein
MTNIIEKMNDPIFREIFFNALKQFQPDRGMFSEIIGVWGWRDAGKKQQDKSFFETAEVFDRQVQKDVGTFVKAAADLADRVMLELYKPVSNQEEDKSHDA